MARRNDQSDREANIAAELRTAAGLAVFAIRSNRLRAFLTLLGIGIGVAVVIAVATVIQGANLYVQEKLASLGSGVFSVQKASITGMGDFEKFLEAQRKNPDITLEDVDAIRAGAAGAEYVAAQGYVSGTARSGNQSLETVSIQGVTPEMLYLSTVDVASGRYVSPFDDSNRRPVVIVGADVATGLFPNTDPLGHELRVDGWPYTIVGVATPLGSVLGQSQDNFVLMPLSTFLKTYGRERSLTVMIRGRESLSTETVQDQVRAILRARHHLAPGEPDDFAVVTDEATEGFFGSILGVISSVTIPVTLISLVVGGIVVMNIMLVTVTERTREVGIRKSLGARRRDILLQFLCESTILSAIGGAAGVLAGYALCKALALVVPIPTGFPVVWSALALALSAGVGLFFGTYPARQAARLDPIEALRAD